MQHLTVFGLCSRCTDRVVCYLVRREQWDAVEMIYDTDATVLMTTTVEAAAIVYAALEELGISTDKELIRREQ